MPPRRKWKGCPFYYESLKILSEIIREPPPKPEVILLCPIWFNWELRTKFDDQLVQLGFIVIKDLFYNGQLISNDFFNERNIQGRLKQKLTTIINRVPQNWIGTVSRSNVITVREVAFIMWSSLIKTTSGSKKKVRPPPGHGESTTNFVIYHAIK